MLIILFKYRAAEKLPTKKKSFSNNFDWKFLCKNDITKICHLIKKSLYRNWITFLQITRSITITIVSRTLFYYEIWYSASSIRFSFPRGFVDDMRRYWKGTKTHETRRKPYFFTQSENSLTLNNMTSLDLIAFFTSIEQRLFF